MNNTDQLYKELLESEYNELGKQIVNLENNNKGLKAITNKNDIEIESLKIRREGIKKQIEEFTQREELNSGKESLLQHADERLENNQKKSAEITQNIEKLQEIRQQLTTRKEKLKIDKKITQKLEQLKKLQKSNNKITKVQKAIMYPKLKKEQKKAKLLAKQQAKINVMQANIRDTQILKEMLEPETSWKDNITNFIYNMKGMYYAKKINRTNEVLQEMQNSNSTVAMRGARVTSLSKKVANKLRRNQKKEETKKMTAEAEAAALEATKSNETGIALQKAS